LANISFENHPDVAFFSIAGDLVSDGLYRDQWDELWAYSKELTSRRPLMCVPGNHDNRLGLGAKMYRDMFSYPLNAPRGINPEQTYSFNYKNALFLMIDATSHVDKQNAWIDEQLKNSDAMWKFAMFHFPPYNWEEPYFDIQEAWVPLFDKYHVDMVFGGHIHYYMRSKPMKGGKMVDSYKNGTAYIISIGIPQRTKDYSDEPYAEVRKMEGQFYQYLKINGNELSYVSLDSEGNVADSFNINKHIKLTTNLYGYDDNKSTVE
jgi:3',5'-cyclic AMP phosphodiesterase CpdA